MARKPRIEFPGAFYHVISRGNQKQDIFLDKQDYKVFLKRICEYKEEYQFTLYAYVLMKNHFHLLVQAGEAGLSKIMQGLLLSYTQYFNLKYKKVGHLFQGRYKAILCNKDEYLLELIRYIHLNPVRAGYVDSPADYALSSHGCFVKDGAGDAPAGMVDVGEALSYFSRDRAVAGQKYRQFVNNGIDKRSDGKFYAVVDQRFLGSEVFVKEISRKVEESFEGFVVVGSEKIQKIVEKIFGVRLSDMIGVRDNGNDAKAVFACLCKRAGHMKNVEIARVLKCDPKTVTNLLRLGNEKYKREVGKAMGLLNSRIPA